MKILNSYGRMNKTHKIVNRSTELTRPTSRSNTSRSPQLLQTSQYHNLHNALRCLHQSEAPLRRGVEIFLIGRVVR